jgi:putative ubiquitin-RnfH superfamily antitoxin RatB of RatAB toxin-antitoxin module
MRVLVVFAAAGTQEVVALDLPQGATVAAALDAAGVRERHPELVIGRVGIWGRCREPGALLREGDRVELYRPLRADAKAMRRARAGLVRTSSRSRNGP